MFPGLNSANPTPPPPGFARTLLLGVDEPPSNFLAAGGSRGEIFCGML